MTTLEIKCYKKLNLIKLYACFNTFLTTTICATFFLATTFFAFK
jgi:hypothetical protein